MIYPAYLEMSGFTFDRTVYEAITSYPVCFTQCPVSSTFTGITLCTYWRR